MLATLTAELLTLMPPPQSADPLVIVKPSMTDARQPITLTTLPEPEPLIVVTWVDQSLASLLDSVPAKPPYTFTSDGIVIFSLYVPSATQTSPVSAFEAALIPA